MRLQFKGLFLAPMAGVTDTVFRGLCREQGADAVVSELISAEGLLRSGKQTLRLLAFDQPEQPLGIQLFGSDPGRMAAAAALVEEHCRPDFIDLNSGCPVPKVVRRNGGAALLRNPALFERIVTAMVKAVKIPLTVKLRSGWNTGEWIDVEFARIAEGSGASAVILHPRSKVMRFSGHALWERITLVKKAVSIPVIGNGDICTPQDAVRMKRETGCDGLMVGRGALGNPWIFRRIKQALADEQIEEIKPAERYAVALRHIALVRERYGEKNAAKIMRKHVAWYAKGQPKATCFRDRIFRAKSTIDLEEIIREISKQHIF
jgi:nifR3 family TIM-barrel protein